MINGRLTTAEAADRLGIKPASLYSYVSRGLLHPDRTSSGSTFDPHEVAVLARTARRPGRSAAPGIRRAAADPSGGDPVFVTALTMIEGGRLYYRGVDAVELSRGRSFEETAEWLWTGRFSDRSEHRLWAVPAAAAGPLARTIELLPETAAPLERFMAAVVAASLSDDLRHDLNPAGVPVTGRAILSVLAASLPETGTYPEPSGAALSISQRVWRGLGGTEVPGGKGSESAGAAAVEAALVLAADHELAPSTLAARVAASFRADPYTVVLTGLGPASGSWPAGSTGAPGEVETLLQEAERSGPEKAVGDRLRRAGEIPFGFGMPLYPDGDPRAAELLGRLEGVGPPERLDLVERVVQLGRQRGFPPPNFDMALGAVSYCGGLVPGAGQALFTLAKVAGWLAHAIEEYTAPTRFRTRADYVGPLPALSPEG